MRIETKYKEDEADAMNDPTSGEDIEAKLSRLRAERDKKLKL